MEHPMSDCIFCEIIAGLSPANFIYQDGFCVVFMDIHPVNPGHALVVPRQHAVLLPELDTATVGHLLKIAQQVDNALRHSGLRSEGVNLFLADGRSAGQDVMHVHLHVIPRFDGDGHHLRFSPSYHTPASTSELGQNAEMIRKQMK